MVPDTGYTGVALTKSAISFIAEKRRELRLLILLLLLPFGVLAASKRGTPSHRVACVKAHNRLLMRLLLLGSLVLAIWVVSVGARHFFVRVVFVIICLVLASFWLH